MRPIHVVGTGLSHDGSSCVMRDGVIVAAIEKERLTRRKHDGFDDSQALEYCLQAAGIGWADIDVFVENNTYNPYETADQRRRADRRLPPDLVRVNIPHHLAHAYSAVGPSGFESCVVAVMDGRGSSLDNVPEADAVSLPAEVAGLPRARRPGWWEKESFYHFDGGRMRALHKDFSPLIPAARRGPRHPLHPPTLLHSIAELYGGATRFVFDDDWAQGKLMGLAPYGDRDRFAGSPLRVIDGRAFVDYEWIAGFAPWARAGRPPLVEESFADAADVAAAVQRSTEDAIVELLRHHAAHAPQTTRLAYAGGLALNCVANARIASDTPFADVFIQPAAGDGGIAIGCAYYGWMEILGREPVPQPYASSFGRAYPAEIDEVVTEMVTGDPACRHDHHDDVADLVASAARLVADGCIVGWYQDGSEFGPRALGWRSILADPQRADMWPRINREIKDREDFRPFAPAVRAEDLHTYYDIAVTESPHMLINAHVRSDYRTTFPATTHIDGSARVQSVDARRNPRFHALLTALAPLTGHPVVLNTSFNGRDEPIVETPRQAADVFAATPMDALVLGDEILVKEAHLVR